MTTENIRKIVKVVSADYTILAGDDEIWLETSGLSLTLPACTDRAATIPLTIIDKSDSSYDYSSGYKTFTPFTLTRAGSDTIDTSYTSLKAMCEVTLRSDGTSNWVSDQAQEAEEASGVIECTTINATTGNITTVAATTVGATTVNAGANGTAGTVNVYPAGGAKGHLAINAANAAGATTTTVTVASQAAARLYTIPDAGADASFLMTAGDQTLADGVDIAVGTSSGTKIGTATNQKLGFYGSTPVDKAANTEDLKDVLVALGFIADSGATPLNLDSGAATVGALTATSVAGTGDVSLTGNTTVTDAKNITVGTTTGSQIATAANQKLGFFGATPVDQAANTEDLKDVLVALGFVATGGATPLNLDSGAATVGALTATSIVGTGEAAITGNATFTDAKNIVLNTTTGSQIGTAANQKLAIYGATPVVQATNTTDLKDALVNFGLVATGGATGLNLDGGALNTGNATVVNLSLTQIMTNFDVYDAQNVGLGTTTGTKIGTAANQKLGFWGATAVVQPSGTGENTGWSAVGGNAANAQDTYNGNSGTAAYTIGDIVKALKAAGILKTNT